MMRRFIAAAFLALLLTAQTHSPSVQIDIAVTGASSCPFPNTAPVDGCNGALPGTRQYPSQLTGYAVRPAWNVAGVDYPVGIPSGTVLNSPTTISMAGVTVNSTTHQVHITASNITLSGYDFSLNGGWSVYVDGGSDVTVEKNNFLIGSNLLTPIAISNQATNTTIQFNVIDGAGIRGTPNQEGLIQGNGVGTITIQYNWIKNTWSELITLSNNIIGATQNILVRRNILENSGLGYSQGAHGDWVQLYNAPNANATSATFVYNLLMQTVPIAQGRTQGLSLYSANSGPTSGGVQTETVENNTVVVTPGGCNGAYVNYAIIIDTSRLIGTGTINNNYVDPTGIGTNQTGCFFGGNWDFVGNYDGTNGGPYNGTVTKSGNKNMLNGAPLTN